MPSTTGTSTKTFWRAGLATVLLVAGLLVAAPAAVASARSGPRLHVPAGTLAAALTCHGRLAGSPVTPVLLVPGTTLTPDVNFSWNYEKEFTATGRPWCAITLPNHAMSDIQVAAEYVVSALRSMHSSTGGRKVSVVGFSQGGMLPRWAFKYWPDTRPMVDDMIGIDPSNHGTVDADAACLLGCAPSIWQQRSTSNFLNALNAGAETYAGISYTQMYTATDEVVVPNAGPAASSSLHTGAGSISNVLVQSICPVHLSDHLSMGTFDPVGYALVLDALTHAGPADAARINRSVCLRYAMPGVSAASVLVNFPKVIATSGVQLATYPHVAAEPPLAAYAQ